jgi:transcription antitermination factor NusA-like protein
LAIGKGGQTARTAAKITGWKIDIHTVEEWSPNSVNFNII